MLLYLPPYKATPLAFTMLTLSNVPPYISTRLALKMIIACTSAAELLPSAVPFINVPPFTFKGAFMHPLLVLFLLSLRYSTPPLFTLIPDLPSNEYPFTSTVTVALAIVANFVNVSVQSLYNVSVQPLFTSDNAAVKALSILSKYFAVPTPEMPAVS